MALQLVQQCSYIVYACKKSAGKVRAVKASVCLHLANLPRFVNSCYEGHASFSLANGTLASLLARRPVVSRRDNAPKSSNLLERTEFPPWLKTTQAVASALLVPTTVPLIMARFRVLRGVFASPARGPTICHPGLRRHGPHHIL